MTHPPRAVALGSIDFAPLGLKKREHRVSGLAVQVSEVIKASFLRLLTGLNLEGDGILKGHLPSNELDIIGNKKLLKKTISLCRVTAIKLRIYIFIFNMIQ